MEIVINFIELHSAYFTFIGVALSSFFISLPKDLNPTVAIELIFKQIALKVNLEQRSDGYKRLASIFSLCLIYCPLILILSQLYNLVLFPDALEALMLFLLLSWHDKKSIYLNISDAMQQNNFAQAKYQLNHLTQRDTKPLSAAGLNKACIESMVLQLTASWFAVIFWFLLAGIYGAIFYRLVQICAQQWNRKHPELGVLSSIPSTIYLILIFPVQLITSFTFALYDRPIKNLPTKFKQSMHWHHFSSGLMLSSFALSMGFELGGVRIYDDQKITYATLGNKGAPQQQQIKASLQRISLTAWFWLFCISSYYFFPQFIALLTTS